MPKIIQSYKNIDVENLVFGIGEYTGKYSTIQLSYKPDSESKCDLMIQGPKMLAPFGISSYDESNKSSHLDMSFGDLTDELQEFYELIEKLNKKCKRKRKKWKISDQQFSNNLKINSRIYPPTLRIKIPMLNNNYHFNVFDDFKNKIEYDKILANSTCTPIIHIKNVWINESNYGLNMQLLQLKVHVSKVLEDYSFIDDEQNSSRIINNIKNNNNITEIDTHPPLRDHPEYGQYFKMLRLKIPRESVLNKMRFNGHDSDIIDLDENKSLEIQTKNHNLEQNNAIKPNELLLGMNKLKKVKKIEKPKNNITNIGLLQPPSKDDLLNAMKKLKKPI